MCLRMFTLKYLLLCFYSVHLIHGRLDTASPIFNAFFKLDTRIVAGLERYVRHETNRLDIIKNSTGYEDEVSIVEERIELLKEFYERAQQNASAITEDIRLLRAHHPTSSYIAIKNFVLNWRPLLRNQTLYGFRLLEFLNVSDTELPDREDLSNIQGDIIFLQHFYNLTASNIYNGDILGVKGEPLTITDAYEIGWRAKDHRKLLVAKEWFELVVEESKKANNKSAVDLPMTLSELALLYYQFGDQEKALSFVEEAYALNDTNGVIYKRFMRIQNDNVNTMSDFDDVAPKYWKNFTEICMSNSTYQTPMQWFHRCRLRCSPNPLRRYKEEILSIAPYLSVFYDIISDDVIEEIKNKTAQDLKKIRNMYYDKYQGTEVEDYPDSGRLLSHLASEISGLNATYDPSTVCSGSPLRVLKYGYTGKAAPHNHMSMVDRFGQQYASVKYYLTDVQGGGATVFLDTGIRYQPKKGSALLWFHTIPMGKNEMRHTTAECPLAVGEKWTVQKDIYAYKNLRARPCARKMLGNQIGVDRAVHQFRHCGF